MPGASVFINFLAGVFFLGFWLFSFVILYHLVRFGIGTFPKKLAGVFLIGTIALFSWSIIAFVSLDLTKISL